MLNKIELIGNLGKDPETKTLTNTQVSKFSIATSESYKDKSGQKVTETEWHDCEVWGKLSEIVDKYLKKGSKVYVSGKIKTQSWDNKDGVKQYRKVVIVRDLLMLGEKEKTDVEKLQERMDEPLF